MRWFVTIGLYGLTAAMVAFAGCGSGSRSMDVTGKSCQSGAGCQAGEGCYKGICASIESDCPTPCNEQQLCIKNTSDQLVCVGREEVDPYSGTSDDATGDLAPPDGSTDQPTAELDTAELDAADIDTAELDAAELDAAELDTAGLDTAELDTAGLDTAELDTAGLDTDDIGTVDIDSADVDALPDVPALDTTGADQQTTDGSGETEDTADGADQQSDAEPKKTCAVDNGGCDKNADCTENVGADPTCKCKDGFEGSGTSCTDINECDTALHNCYSKQTCVNTPGSFECTCMLLSGRVVCRVPNDSTTGTAVCSSIARSCIDIPKYAPLETACKAFHPSASVTSSASGNGEGVYCDSNSGALTGVCAGKIDTCHNCPGCVAGLDCNTGSTSLYTEWYADCGAE